MQKIHTTCITGHHEGNPMTRPGRTIYRDTDDQKIGGVCSGLARYFDLDPLLVRVAFVAALFLSGASLVAYLLLWWLVDPAPAGTWDDDATDTGQPAGPTLDGSPA